MGKSQKKAHLSPAERIEIADLYSEGGWSYRTLAKKFGVSFATIQRIVKSAENEPAPPPVIVTESEYIVDPIDFRKQKLIEIGADIISTRIRGSVQVLPALHRLHLTTHDELTSMRKERDAMDDVTNPDELLQTIAIAVQGLPPILKDQLHDMMNTDFRNVIPFAGGDE